jgi:hypothetical protein
MTHSWYLTMKELVIPMDFNAKRVTCNDITLPVIASTICKNASTLCIQKLNDSLAKEPISTQDANKRGTWMLDTNNKKSQSPVNCQRRLQASKCQLSKKLLQLLIKYESLFDGILHDWKTKLVFFQAKKENNYTRAELSRC